MTITYSLDIASSTFLGIHRLLLRWKGSIWKSIWPELLCWLIFYFALSLWYRMLMSKEQRILFEDVCVFFNTYSEYIPITFMLGFYVSAVFGRWGEIFMNLGWIDSPALLIATIVRGTSEEARNIRRNIVRYLVLVQAMVFRDISASVKKRFPSMDHLVTAGIMTPNELREFDAIETEHIKYWTPIQWAFLLLRKARDKGMIDSDIIYIDMLEKIRQYRVNVLTLTLYDWVPIPLVYTQVVNLAVRCYFAIALLGRQYLSSGDRDLPNKNTIDLVFPIMTMMQFLFYMGWVKVAEVLLNPLGEDDDDFETNWIIDRNLQVGLCIVDDCYGRVPSLERDQFWDKSNPQLLYTPESAARPQNPMIGSCNDSNQQEDMLLLQPQRRRLMSTVAGPDVGIVNKGFESEESVLPVVNHNPTKRTLSVVHHDRGFLDTVKRKLSRTNASRRGSTDSDFERALGNKVFDRHHFSRVSSQSTKSSQSIGDSVQNFLWGGRLGKHQHNSQAEHREGPDQPSPNSHQQSDSPNRESPANPNKGGKKLSVIQEEEAGDSLATTTPRGDAKCSTSTTSLESVSSSSLMSSASSSRLGKISEDRESD